MKPGKVLYLLENRLRLAFWLCHAFKRRVFVSRRSQSSLVCEYDRSWWNVFSFLLPELRPWYRFLYHMEWRCHSGLVVAWSPCIHV